MWGLPSSCQLHANGQRQRTKRFDCQGRGAAEQVPQAATDLFGARHDELSMHELIAGDED
jgi:hypothetical protein